MKKTIGILGGMGSEATAYFFELIINNTEAQKDQEHIPILIWNNPKIPPRTDAILCGGKSPLSLLLEGVRILRRAGADFIVMPCITAHYYFPKIISREKIPFINLIEETLHYAQKKIPHLKKVGLIASSGTISSKLFHNLFLKEGIEIMEPLGHEQKKVMEAIFGQRGIKAGFTSGLPRKLMVNSARKLIQRGAEAVIAGCTEVPLVLRDKDISRPLIEPLHIAALACIQKAGYKIKS